MPGSPLDPRAKGCNRLLRDGATLTESAEDVLAVLRPMIGRDFDEPGGRAHRPRRPKTGRRKLTRCGCRWKKRWVPPRWGVDELIRLLGAPAGAVLTVLLELELELAGRCARHPGNRVSWR